MDDEILYKLTGAGGGCDVVGCCAGGCGSNVGGVCYGDGGVVCCGSGSMGVKPDLDLIAVLERVVREY